MPGYLYPFYSEQSEGLLPATSFFLSDIFIQGEVLHYQGGSPVLFEHLFWFLGHPEVYIVLLPALGITSEIISTNSRKPIFGYRAMVASILAIAFLSTIPLHLIIIQLFPDMNYFVRAMWVILIAFFIVSIGSFRGGWRHLFLQLHSSDPSFWCSSYRMLRCISSESHAALKNALAHSS